eukprot:1914359-Amphidinium_carterae.1
MYYNVVLQITLKENRTSSHKTCNKNNQSGFETWQTLHATSDSRTTSTITASTTTNYNTKLGHKVHQVS